MFSARVLLAQSTVPRWRSGRCTQSWKPPVVKSERWRFVVDEPDPLTHELGMFIGALPLSQGDFSDWVDETVMEEQPVTLQPKRSRTKAEKVEERARTEQVGFVPRSKVARRSFGSEPMA